ncbi:MAG: VanZ family protein [bacterium]
MKESPTLPSVGKASNRRGPAFLWLAAALGWAIWVIAMGTESDPRANWLTNLLGDKALHAGSFAVGGMLWIHSLRRVGDIAYGIAAVLGCVVCLAFGVLLEVLQKRIPGREADPNDLVADMAGIVAAMGLYLLASWVSTRRHASRKHVEKT